MAKNVSAKVIRAVAKAYLCENILGLRGTLKLSESANFSRTLIKFKPPNQGAKASG